MLIICLSDLLQWNSLTQSKRYWQFRLCYKNCFMKIFYPQEAALLSALTFKYIFAHIYIYYPVRSCHFHDKHSLLICFSCTMTSSRGLWGSSGLLIGGMEDPSILSEQGFIYIMIHNHFSLSVFETCIKYIKIVFFL